MGFFIVEGLEVEIVENNFDVLNVFKDYLLRDMSDIFYINDGVLFRI